MIEVLEGLDRALCAARTEPDDALNHGSQDGSSPPHITKEQRDHRRRALLGLHQRVLTALDCEVPSIAFFAATAELALAVSVDADDPETRFVDLWCSLRHWADANGVDVEAALNRAEGNYASELINVHSGELPSSYVKWRREVVKERS